MSSSTENIHSAPAELKMFLLLEERSIKVEMLIEMQSITCLKAPLYLSYLPYFGDIGPGISGTRPFD